MSAAQKRTYVASRRVIEAFGGRAFVDALAVVVETHEFARSSRLLVRTFRGEEHAVTALDGSEVSEALERADLTRYHGESLVLVSRLHRLLGIAIGPPEPPELLQVMATVVRLGPNGAVEILGDDGQPSWLLFEIEKGASDVVDEVGPVGLRQV